MFFRGHNPDLFCFGQPLDLKLSFWFIALTLVIDSFTVKANTITELTDRIPVYIRWPIYYALLLLVIFFAKTDERRFIYFQF